MSESLPNQAVSLQPHELRVVDEKRELDERLAKLEAFRRTTSFHINLDAESRALLLSQLSIMTTYSEILGKRIARFARPASKMSDAQIKHMVGRFLGWRLPDDFSPDAGISFKPEYNEPSPMGPSRHEPVGTNLFNALQAEAMIRHLVAGLPA